MPNFTCRFCQKVILYLQATRYRGTIKRSDGCNNWFHQHCENFEIPTNCPYNSSNFFCRACQKLPTIHINSLPYIVLDRFFLKSA